MTATMFPSKPVGSVSTTVFKTFNSLKTLPDDYMVWLYMNIWQENMPDFLVMDPDAKAILIKVCDATPKHIKSRIQMVLLGDNEVKTGEREVGILSGFMDQVQDELGENHFDKEALRKIVLFPNLTSREVTRIKSNDRPDDILWLGKNYCESDNLEKLISLFPSKPLDALSHQVLRKIFTPESIVPKSITVRQKRKDIKPAGLDDFFLDYEQERVLKNDLEIPAEAAPLTRDFRLGLINGVAGSGKTLILLYRLRLLNELYPDKKFLVMTHNRALIRDMQLKYYRLCGAMPKNVEWKTFYSWLQQNYPGPYKKAVSLSRKDKIIRKIRAAVFGNTSVSDGMVRSEIDWINDQIDRTKEWYLSVDRRGRGFRLSQQQRLKMYDAYEKFLNELKNEDLTDWGIMPHEMIGAWENGETTIPQYDVILIDEAQFFAPAWFEIVRKIIKAQTGHLFMVADPTQGFLDRGISWKSMGLEVRGKTDELKKSFRTTKEILSLATIFYRQRAPSDSADENILEPDTMEMPEGVVPKILTIPSYQEEINYVTTEIFNLVKKHNIPKKQILVLHANWEGVNRLLDSINKKLGRGSAKDPSEKNPGNYIRVTNLNRSTGIESPIVFFVGMQQLMEMEQSLRISEEEREKLILENTRKIYMAMTRAGQRLVITYAGAMPADLRWMFQ